MAFVWLFYLPMFAGVFFVRPPGVLYTPDWIAGGIGMAIALFSGIAIVAASRWSAEHTLWGRQLKSEFRSMLGRLDSTQILVLALLSSMGEEILFRGVLQAHLGLLWTSLLFGLVHFPYRKELIPWSIFALVLGVGLGWLTIYSETLWPAIFLHFYINYFNLHDLVQTTEQSPSTETE